MNPVISNFKRFLTDRLLTTAGKFGKQVSKSAIFCLKAMHRRRRGRKNDRVVCMSACVAWSTLMHIDEGRQPKRHTMTTHSERVLRTVRVEVERGEAELAHCTEQQRIQQGLQPVVDFMFVLCFRCSLVLIVSRESASRPGRSLFPIPPSSRVSFSIISHPDI